MSETITDVALVAHKSVSDPGAVRMRHGTAMIFHILPTDEFMFFLRDKAEDKPGLPHPNRVCLIGGGVKNGETPEQTIRREVGKEVFHIASNLPYEMGKIDHLKTLYDERPGEIDVYAHQVDEIPALYIVEGQGLVILSREETLQTDFPYGFNETIYNYVESNPTSYLGALSLGSAAQFCVTVAVP
jgi:hypothetical protein